MKPQPVLGINLTFFLWSVSRETDEKCCNFFCFLAQKMKLAVVSYMKLTEIMKPHFFTKTGQKLVFLRKNKWTFVSETRKKCGSVSWNWVSFIKKVEFHKKRKFHTKNKVTFQITPHNVDYGLTSFNQKPQKMLQTWF